jgi:hypothetical protein
MKPHEVVGGLGVYSTEHQLWDDAKGLVRLNREKRAGSRYCPAWPHYMYAVGYPHGDEMIAVDTHDPEGPVWWLDHGVIGHQASYKTHVLGLTLGVSDSERYPD